MNCQFLDRRSPFARRWHLLRCRECRTARVADRVLLRGIDRLRAETASEEGLARTLAAVGIHSVAPPHRNRIRLGGLRRALLPATATSLLLAGGWLTYIDMDPHVVISTPAMPSPNAFDLLNRISLSSKTNQDIKAAFISKVSIAQTKAELDRLHAVDVDNWKIIDRYQRSHGLYKTIVTRDGKVAQVSTGFLPNSVKDPIVMQALANQNHALYKINQLNESIQMMDKHKAIVNSNAAVLASLRKALTYPYEAKPIRSAGDQTPYFATYRQLAELLELDARVKEANGDLTGALNSRLDAMQLGAEVPHGSLIIGKLVGIACENIGRNPLWKMVDQLDATQARAAARRVAQIMKRHVPFSASLQEEQRVQQAEIMGVFRQSGWRTMLYVSNMSGGEDSWLPRMASYFRLLPYSKSRIMQDFIEITNSNIQDARLPYAARRSTRNRDTGLYPASDIDPLTSIFCGTYNQCGFIDAAACETQDALLLTTLALRAYQQEHHSYPQSLTSLAPEYLAEVPADPFLDGQPLHYQRLGQSYRLYSVGPDGKDNGGMPIDTAASGNTAQTGNSHGQPLAVNGKVHGTLSPNGQRIADAIMMRRYVILPESKGDIVAGINVRTSTNDN